VLKNDSNSKVMEISDLKTYQQTKTRENLILKNKENRTKNKVQLNNSNEHLCSATFDNNIYGITNYQNVPTDFRHTS
jgi:hypothetical protein